MVSNYFAVFEVQARSAAANGNDVNKTVETAFSIMRSIVTISIFCT